MQLAQPPPGMRPPPTRSRILAKFGKTKTLNPFAEEEKQVILNMSEGTQVLLNMHNAAELSALCGVMCLSTEGTNRDKKERVLKFVADETMRTHNPEKAYSRLLHLMWEGILFEYLRSMGCPLKGAEVDPRPYTLSFWRQRAQQSKAGTFAPHYVQRMVRPRFINDELDDDIRALLNGVAAKEVYVKESEKRIRGPQISDHRNVVMYLAAVTDMHDFEQDARSYLMNETMQLRGRLDHAAESLELTRAQAEEMEGKHYVMADQWCRTLAAQEASVDVYVGMLNDQLCDRNALAAQVEAFLISHGGRAGNRLKEPTPSSGPNAAPLSSSSSPSSKSGSNDLADLLPRLLARYELDLAKASRAASASAKHLTDVETDRRRLERVLASESRRADDLETECERLKAKHGALQEAAAAKIAQLELEVEHWSREAGSGFVEREVQARRFALVLPGLLAALESGVPEEEGRVVATLEGLGIMDRQGILQHLEGNLMRREDLAQRAGPALAAAKHARVDTRDSGLAAKKSGGGKKGGVKKKK